MGFEAGPKIFQFGEGMERLMRRDDRLDTNTIVYHPRINLFDYTSILAWTNMSSSSSAQLTPFEALSSVHFSFRMSRSMSRVYKLFSFKCSPFESSVGDFTLLIRGGLARE